MPISVDDVLRLLCSISNKRDLQAVTTGQWRGIVQAGVCGGIGVLLAGPPGLFVGSVLGGLVGARMAREKREPVSQVLKRLRGAQQQKLFGKVKDIICNLDSMTAELLTEWVMGSETLQQQLVDMLVEFLKKELKIPSVVGK